MPETGDAGRPRTVPATGPVKVVIDSSVWLPVLTRPLPQNHWILQAAKRRAIIIYGSRKTDSELQRKLRERYSPSDGVNAYIPARKAYRHYDQYREASADSTEAETPQCADPDDQMFIDLAYASGAELLLTRDGKLLAMNGQTLFSIIDDRDAKEGLAPD